MRSAPVKWSVGTLTFCLPALVGIIGDTLGRSPATNASRFVADLPAIFVAAVLLAAGACAGILMTVPISFARRLAFVAGAWCTLLVEAWLTIIWSLRGLH